MQFKEHEFEDILVENIKALDIQIQGKRLYVDLMEGNGLDVNKPEVSVYVQQWPACIIGIRGLISADPLTSMCQEYNIKFDLRVWISAYDKQRKAGETSDIRTIREKIRKEIYGKNPYKFGDNLVILKLESDDFVTIISNDIIIYEQIYTGKYIEN